MRNIKLHFNHTDSSKYRGKFFPPMRIMPQKKIFFFIYFLFPNIYNLKYSARNYQVNLEKYAKIKILEIFTLSFWKTTDFPICFLILVDATTINLFLLKVKHIFTCFLTIEIFINPKVTIKYIMEHLTCFYHPNREATQKCSKCGKLICLECQTTVRSTTSSNVIHERVYCPECGKIAKNIRKIFMLVGFVLMGIMLIFALNFMDVIWYISSDY